MRFSKYPKIYAQELQVNNTLLSLLWLNFHQPQRTAIMSPQCNPGNANAMTVPGNDKNIANLIP